MSNFTLMFNVMTSVTSIKSIHLIFSLPKKYLVPFIKVTNRAITNAKT